MPHVSFSQTTIQILSTILVITHVLESIYILRALKTGTCSEQGDLFYFCWPTQEPMLVTAKTRRTQEVLGKMQINGLER